MNGLEAVRQGQVKFCFVHCEKINIELFVDNLRGSIAKLLQMFGKTREPFGTCSNLRTILVNQPVHGLLNSEIFVKHAYMYTYMYTCIHVYIRG